MKLRVVALATLITLLSLCHSSTQEEERTNNNNPFDPYPHPPFPEIDCKKVLELKGIGGCPAVTYNATAGKEKDERVCAEYRMWYHSHCRMMANHCEQMKNGMNLIGTCHHKNRARVHHTKRKAVPYRTCKDHPDETDYNQYYCPMGKQEKHLCGVYMKSYESMCHMLVDFCEVKKDKNYELAKIISPRRHSSLFMNHNYYDKCGMYSPLNSDHEKSHFKEVYPSLVMPHSVHHYNKNVRPYIYKYDHVCKNNGTSNFGHSSEKKEREGYHLRESDTLIHDNSLEEEDESLRAQNGHCDKIAKIIDEKH